MARITITEALSQVESLDRHLDRKERLIQAFVVRSGHLTDLLAREGGAEAVLERERRSVHLLHERKILIRRAVQEANQSNFITVGQQTRTIADWLVWRREVVAQRQQFFETLRQRIDQARKASAMHPARRASGNSGTPNGLDVVVHLDEQTLVSWIEELEECVGLLDGQLTLKNAVLQIDLPPDETWQTGLEGRIDALLALAGVVIPSGMCSLLLDGLTDPTKKILAIKVVREVTGLGLAEAKAAVEGASCRLKENVPHEEAVALKRKLEDAGLRVRVSPAFPGQGEQR